MAALPFALLAQGLVGIAQSARDFSSSTARHAVATSHTTFEVLLVVLGVIVVVVTTVYTLLYFVRPRETGPDHIKRRILRDGR